MNLEKTVSVIEQVLLGRSLTPIERLVFCQSWMGQSYDEIAQDLAYGSDYLKQIGSKLWNDLSEVLGERVTKKNLRLVLERYQQHQAHEFHPPAPFISMSSRDEIQTDFEFPGRPLALSSLLYIHRPPLEELALSEIHKPGCVLRIKAPRKMGKSSLINRVIANAVQTGYHTVFLDFQETDRVIFGSLNKFLRWFCANVSQQLQVAPKLDEYWDEDIGSKVSCRLYFEGYLLTAIHHPLVLVLNEVNQIFEYPEIAQDFLPMLRAWHELATQVELWQKLRLVVVYATDVYVPLQVNQSPFNIGLALKLPEFNITQIQELALRHGLTWAEGEAGIQHLVPLIEIVGGHPYLINIAFYHLCQGNVTLEALVKNAVLATGIYSHHLQSLLLLLQEEKDLMATLKSILLAEKSISVNAIAAYKLESLGLIHFNGYHAQPSCKLYRLYFTQQLKSMEEVNRE
jgi:hypothetical protein